MTEADPENAVGSLAEEVVGAVAPTSDRAVRALRALEQNRLRDAEANIAAMSASQPKQRAWKLLLRGMLATERRDFAAAEVHLSRSVAAALEAGLDENAEPGAEAMRLAALGFDRIGSIHRRQDQPATASRAHQAAFLLRLEHGSCEEVWESANALGLDAGVAARHADAQTWYRQAVAIARSAAEAPHHKEAISWANLTDALAENGQLEDAVEAARSAHEAFRRHDVGAVATALAEMRLGHTLLRRGEALHDVDPGQARGVLAEAISHLETAHESLLPFGPSRATDARWCAEQKDFAERLRASLDA